MKEKVCTPIQISSTQMIYETIMLLSSKHLRDVQILDTRF